MMDGWHKVYSTDSAISAELVKGVLENNGLHAVVVGKRDSSYNNFGEQEVYVDRDHVLLALKIIQHDLSLR